MDFARQSSEDTWVKLEELIHSANSRNPAPFSRTTIWAKLIFNNKGIVAIEIKYLNAQASPQEEIVLFLPQGKPKKFVIEVKEE